MLTEIQKESLHNLMKNCPFPKLKSILEKSIPKWISGEIIPKRFDLGLIIRNEKFVCSGDNKACLIGSALIDEKAIYSSGGPWKKFYETFDIDEDTIAEIMTAFDTGNHYNRPIPKYVAEIHKVLFN